MQISSMNSVNTAFCGRPYRAIPLSSLFDLPVTSLQKAREKFQTQKLSLGLDVSYSDVDKLCREKLDEFGNTGRDTCVFYVKIGDKKYRVDWYKPNGGYIRNIQENNVAEDMISKALMTKTKKWS